MSKKQPAPAWMTAPFKKKKPRVRLVKKPRVRIIKGTPTITLSAQEFLDIIDHLQDSPDISFCEECGAWLTTEEVCTWNPDFVGCQYAVTMDKTKLKDCKRRRAELIKDAKRFIYGGTPLKTKHKV